MGNPPIEQLSVRTGTYHHRPSLEKNNQMDSTVTGELGDGVDIGSFPVKIPIIGFETMEERAKFTVFKLRVENEKVGESWSVFRRYTDFVRLHAKLKEDISEFDISIPPKRWLRDNFETAFLEERMKGLQAFVDSILVHPKLVSLPTVRKFFCLDEPPSNTDPEENKSWYGSTEDSATNLKHKLVEKEREIELLKTELVWITTQRDNLLKTARNCRNCCQKHIVVSTCISASSQLGACESLPSSGSSSENGSPRHRPALFTRRNSVGVHSSPLSDPDSYLHPKGNKGMEERRISNGPALFVSETSDEKAVTASKDLDSSRSEAGES